MLRVTPCAVFVSICSLMVACPRNDDPADDSSSGDSTTGTPTTGDDTSTGVATSTGASETTATTGGASETGVMVDEDMLCAAYAAHFVDCFPQGTTVGEVEAQCHDDLDSARASSEACFGALAAYFECQSLAACEVFADSCLDEANARINICGG
jgi:hypothetical protein